MPEHVPIEAESRVSEELAAAMEAIANDPDREEPATLALVRDKLRQQLAAQGVEATRHEFGEEQSLYAEVEALIDEYGEDALALEFTAVKASDELSEVIETILDNSDADTLPTLEKVRAEMAESWLGRLAGEGVIEPDQEQSLLAEIDALIERYGPDLPAENLLRFD
jgi:chitinase